MLEPRFDEMTVEEMKRVVEFQWMDMIPEMVDAAIREKPFLSFGGFARFEFFRRAENMIRLYMDAGVEDEELDRARNMLKCNVLTQLESRLVLFEDIGRQILTYGKREGTADMCQKIDSVDNDALLQLVRKSVKGMKPTLVAVGDDVSHIPAFEEVERWFGSLS